MCFVYKSTLFPVLWNLAAHSLPDIMQLHCRHHSGAFHGFLWRTHTHTQLTDIICAPGVGSYK